MQTHYITKQITRQPVVNWSTHGFTLCPSINQCKESHGEFMLVGIVTGSVCFSRQG